MVRQSEKGPTQQVQQNPFFLGTYDNKNHTHPEYKVKENEEELRTPNHRPGRHFDGVFQSFFATLFLTL